MDEPEGEDVVAGAGGFEVWADVTLRRLRNSNEPQVVRLLSEIRERVLSPEAGWTPYANFGSAV